MHSALAIPADSAVQPVRSDSDSAAQPGKVPIIEVAFKNGMWWSIPPEISQALYQKHSQGEDACYTWDKRCYVVDFYAMEEQSIDNGCLRTIRIAWVDFVDVAPRWTGQIPQ